MVPDKAQYRPGDAIRLHAPGANQVAVSELGRPIAVLPVQDDYAHWTAPAVGPDAARGFRAEAQDQDGHVIETTAFDVAKHWSVAPRMGFLCDFKPSDTLHGIPAMNRLHINVVQYYDWMYTHYEFFAATPEFVDPMGRATSHLVVQAKVDLCHEHGIACLAYGALYGGEKPIADQHPDWLLYDPAGQPFALGPFYIQHMGPESGWRAYILDQFDQAITRLGFDGIHIDQYGFPKRAVFRPADGAPTLVDLTTAMPEFVAAAAVRGKQLRPDGGTGFNCVNTWPISEMAPHREDAYTYMELWAPHETYRDLHDVIRYAKAAGPHKQVVIAAYLKAFHRHEVRPTAAMTSLRLATAAIFASGGFYLLLGEGNGVLAQDYFPNFGRLDPQDLTVVEQYWDFVTAYGELLHDRTLRDVSYTWNGVYITETQYEAPVPCSPLAEPGTVWTILKERPGRRILNLINLTGATSNRWNEVQPDPSPVDGIRVTFQAFGPVHAAWAASPDTGGVPERLVIEADPEGKPFIHLRLPRLHYWQTVWIEE